MGKEHRAEESMSSGLENLSLKCWLDFQVEPSRKQLETQVASKGRCWGRGQRFESYLRRVESVFGREDKMPRKKEQKEKRSESG